MLDERFSSGGSPSTGSSGVSGGVKNLQFVKQLHLQSKSTSNDHKMHSKKHQSSGTLSNSSSSGSKNSSSSSQSNSGSSNSSSIKQGDNLTISTDLSSINTQLTNLTNQMNNIQSSMKKRGRLYTLRTTYKNHRSHKVQRPDFGTRSQVKGVSEYSQQPKHLTIQRSISVVPRYKVNLSRSIGSF